MFTLSRFKVRYGPLEAKQGEQQIIVLTEDMKLSAFDKFKNKLGFGGGK